VTVDVTTDSAVTSPAPVLRSAGVTVRPSSRTTAISSIRPASGRVATSISSSWWPRTTTTSPTCNDAVAVHPIVLPAAAIATTATAPWATRADTDAPARTTSRPHHAEARARNGAANVTKKTGSTTRGDAPAVMSAAGTNVPSATTNAAPPSRATGGDAHARTPSTAGWRLIATTSAPTASVRPPRRNQPTSLASANACCETVVPERVMKLPAPAASAATTTSTDVMRSRRACTAATATSHGIKAAFSIGSHAQKPPHPSSSYAQRAPLRSPAPRRTRARHVQRRRS
jgi:hypothetical protein